MKECIFCKIVSGDSPCHKIWEDRQHLAFLSIFPNTAGTTVVITKKHQTSYVFDLPDRTLSNLMLATKKVAKLLDSKLDDVGRTAMVFEGFGVDHIHAKLFPMHGTADLKEWKPIESKVDKYFDKYEGYISSHDYRRADDLSLSELAGRLFDKRSFFDKLSQGISAIMNNVTSTQLFWYLAVFVFFTALFIGSYILIYGNIVWMALDFFSAFSLFKEIYIIFIFAIFPVCSMIYISKNLISIHPTLFLLALPINEGVSFISIMWYMLSISAGNSEFGQFLTSPAYFFHIVSDLIIVAYVLFGSFRKRRLNRDENYK